MQTTFQKLKESVTNPEIRIRVALDPEVRFAVNIELVSILGQWIGLYTGMGLLIFAGTAGFWYGVVQYVKNILRIHDEWKAEKEKEESSSNEGDTEESKED